MVDKTVIGITILGCSILLCVICIAVIVGAVYLSNSGANSNGANDFLNSLPNNAGTSNVDLTPGPLDPGGFELGIEPEPEPEPTPEPTPQPQPQPTPQPEEDNRQKFMDQVKRHLASADVDFYSGRDLQNKIGQLGIGEYDLKDTKYSAMRKNIESIKVPKYFIVEFYEDTRLRGFLKSFNKTENNIDEWGDETESIKIKADNQKIAEDYAKIQ